MLLFSRVLDILLKGKKPPSEWFTTGTICMSNLKIGVGSARLI